MYQDALVHVYENFPQLKELLASLDVKIEYQRYSHPDFNSYELWSILWCDAKRKVTIRFVQNTTQQKTIYLQQVFGIYLILNNTKRSGKQYF